MTGTPPEDALAGLGILVVEDDPATASVIRGICEKYGAGDVYSAGDGLEALGVLAVRGDAIDVLVLDIVMPKMSGIDMLRHLVQHHPLPLGVVIQSGYVPGDVAEEVLDDPDAVGSPVADGGFLAKPFSGEDLVVRVQHAAEAARRKRDKIRKAVAGDLDGKVETLVARTAALHRVDAIEETLQRLDRRNPGFLAQLGLDLIRIILIALAAVALLSVGLGDWIRSIIN